MQSYQWDVLVVGTSSYYTVPDPIVAYYWDIAFSFAHASSLLLVGLD